MSINENVTAVDVSADASGVHVESTDAVRANQPEQKKPASPRVEVQDETENESDNSQTDDGDDTEESSDTSKDEKKKRKSGFERRIEKLNARIAERERELDQLRTDSKRGQASSQDVATSEAAQVADEKPKADNFESHEEYVEALTDWKLDQREKQKETKSREESLKSEQQKVESAHQERMAEFIKETPEMGELLAENSDMQISLGLRHGIIDSDMGPAVLFELLKDPDTFDRINGLNPWAISKEIGKIEARLEQSATSERIEQPKKQTKAPAPLKGLSAKGSAQPKSLEDMDYEDYRKARLEQMKNNRR